MAKSSSDNFSRRAFIKGSGAAAAATALTENVTAAAAPSGGSSVVSGWSTVTLNVNGQDRQVKVEPRTTLLDVLRYQLDLTGAKPVSNDGISGASTVMIDDRPATASTLLALSVRGKSIRTIEDLGDDTIPKAFVEHDAQQCGFCTPGFIVAVRAFLNRHPKATKQQILTGLNGNICRCGTYANIIQAATAIVKGGGNG